MLKTATLSGETSHLPKSALNGEWWLSGDKHVRILCCKRFEAAASRATTTASGRGTAAAGGSSRFRRGGSSKIRTG